MGGNERKGEMKMKDCGEVAWKKGIQQNRIDTLQLW